jgi:hypothetical protein
VTSGTLTADSIVCDTLTIGSPAAAAYAVSAEVSNTVSTNAADADSLNIDSTTALDTPGEVIPLALAALSKMFPADPVVDRMISVLDCEPVANTPVAGLSKQAESRFGEPLFAQAILEEPLGWAVHAGLYLASRGEHQPANAISWPSPMTERQPNPLAAASDDSSTRAKAQASASRISQRARHLALQSLMRELQQDFASAREDATLLAAKQSLKSDKLAPEAVDDFHASLVACD